MMEERRVRSGASVTRYWQGLLLAAAVAVTCCGRSADEAVSFSQVVDLGHPLSATDPSWTGERVFSREVVATMEKDGYQAGRFTTDEHFGTHVDAPVHFAPDGLAVDQIPPDRLVRPGVCVNIRSKVRRGDIDYRLSVDDLDAFERDHGRIPEGAVVLVATGWDERWGRPTGEYMNLQEGVHHFPGISVEAAKMLANRRVAGIGIDTPSIDYGPSQHFEAHHLTLAAGLYHIENARGLTELPPTGFTVIVAPIDIKGGTGGPARLLALLPR